MTREPARATPAAPPGGGAQSRVPSGGFPSEMTSKVNLESGGMPRGCEELLGEACAQDLLRPAPPRAVAS
jgi:hypothetical protein